MKVPGFPALQFLTSSQHRTKPSGCNSLDHAWAGHSSFFPLPSERIPGIFEIHDISLLLVLIDTHRIQMDERTTSSHLSWKVNHKVVTLVRDKS